MSSRETWMGQRRSVCRVLCLLALAGTLFASPTVMAAEPATIQKPQELMDSVAQQMFAALDANRAQIRKNPDKALPLVDAILLPHFDTEYAARLVLARHWNDATAEQRNRFVLSLYHALLRLYGSAIADFTADRLKLLPYRGDDKSNEAVVHTMVRRDSGAMVPVDYRLHLTPGGWKVYDVIIEGISYVKNYRTDLGAEIDQKGLEEVIQRLDQEGLASAVKR